MSISPWSNPPTTNVGAISVLSVQFKTGTVTAALKSGDGDGTSGGMEARVAKLEASVSHLERDMAEVRSDVRKIQETLGGDKGILVRMATLETKVDHLPTKDYITARLLVLLAVLGALTVFQHQIQTFLHLMP